ncbi:hypothetical protein RIVM261_077670 [Rivularia sp. IAM M-261]|nr:hypothetical protein RIVM261_077670 [Rivularia sp. IAM M-261]
MKDTELLVETQTKDFALAADYHERLALKRGQYIMLNFWVIFSIAFESLLKAVLIHYEKDGVFCPAKTYKELRRPIRSQFIKLTPPDLPQVSGDGVVGVEWTSSGDLVVVQDYLKTGTRVVIQNSGWLKDQFQKHGFEYLLQINTCTLSNAGQMVALVMKQNGISAVEADRIDFACQHLAQLRRNRDLHCYFGEQVLMRVYYGECDLTDIYIPSVNKLIQFFHQK